MSEKKIRILHLEDEEVHQIKLAMALRKAEVPVQITLVESTREAIDALMPGRLTADVVAELLAHPLFDLIVADVHVKDTDEYALHSRMDGYLVVEKALGIGYRPDQIIFSSNTPDASRTFPDVPMHEKAQALGIVVLAAQQMLLEH